jgi:hypothetical protein
MHIELSTRIRSTAGLDLELSSHRYSTLITEITDKSFAVNHTHDSGDFQGDPNISPE